MVCKFFDKKTGSWVSVNEHLAEELHKPVTKEIHKQKVLFKIIFGNIWNGIIVFKESFQEVNTLFVLLLETNVDRIWHTDYFLPKAERKECSVLIDWRNFFDKPTRNNLKTWKY